MTLTALGINHKSASVALREKVAFSPDAMVDALQSLRALDEISEAVILSTCNRTELYVSHTTATPQFLLNWLAQFHNLDLSVMQPHLYVKSDDEALCHLMRVSSGLDSLVMGEPQILGQVKQAFNLAKQNGLVNTEFERLFQYVFNVAKKVRNETEIGANAVSIAFAAVQLAKHIFAALDKRAVLLIGAGETIELVAKHLMQANVKQLTVANRTIDRAKNVAEGLGASVITLAQLPEKLHQFDIVISSTASQLPLVGKGMVEDALKKRRNKPVFLVDLAVPRDIEPQVDELGDAYLYTVDDLQQIVEANLASREQAAKEAESLIDEQLVAYTQWQRSSEQRDYVKLYRQQCSEIQQQYVTKATAQLQDGKDPEQVMRELSHKLSNALMHAPTKILKDAVLHDIDGVSERLTSHFEFEKRKVE